MKMKPENLPVQIKCCACGSIAGSSGYLPGFADGKPVLVGLWICAECEEVQTTGQVMDGDDSSPIFEGAPDLSLLVHEIQMGPTKSQHLDGGEGEE